jgi:hypothetical protein
VCRQYLSFIEREGDIMNYIKWLEEWYKSYCNGDWEHGYGVKIETLDNPGWTVKIDLYDTELEDKEFSKLFIDNSDDDWIACKVEDKKFKGAGDPNKLEEIIKVFKEWVES